jgi:hypothetical protein
MAAHHSDHKFKKQDSSLTRSTPFSSCMSRLRPIVSHPHCHTNDSFLFVTRFPSSSHYADRPSPSFHAAQVSLGPSQVDIGLDHLYVRKDFYFASRTFSFISLPSLPRGSVAGKPPFTFGSHSSSSLRFSCLYFALDSGFVKRHLRPRFTPSSSLMCSSA